jgi:hypothetical protein
LTATANAIGTFTWSNGMSGASIFETAGGPYQVLFTSASGCTATDQIYVPKDLSSYLWVVPKGCYTFCDNKPTQQLLGPAVQEFPSWAWLQNSVATPSGIQTVTPKNLNVSGSYQLQLSNATCDFKSDALSINYVNCVRNIDCNWLNASVTTVAQVTTPYVYYSLVINITNTSGSDSLVTITTQNSVGFFIPAVLNVPPGGGSYSLIIIPNNNFLGGPISILATATDRNGNLCQKTISTSLPGVIEPSNRVTNKKIVASSLKVYPNPAKEMVTIDFDYPTSNGATQIQLYDTTTRLINSYNPASTKGSWELPVGNLSAGMYIVVLKQDGVVIGQQNLIKQ